MHNHQTKHPATTISGKKNAEIKKLNIYREFIMRGMVVGNQIHLNPLRNKCKINAIKLRQKALII